MEIICLALSDFIVQREPVCWRRAYALSWPIRKMENLSMSLNTVIINKAAQSLNEIKSMSRTTTQDYYTIKSRVDFDM
ncbi:MAG: hypothetical protein IJP56_03715 [Synergistaceae bacterium]|nr:hypothetical protein [Synergistaceae bacterium]MBR0221364.1 hypothetical protein [Synergistaceae bacterium]